MADAFLPPAKRRKIEENLKEMFEPKQSAIPEEDDDDEIDYSQFMKPKKARKPRVGAEYQTVIPEYQPKEAKCDKGFSLGVDVKTLQDDTENQP